MSNHGIYHASPTMATGISAKSSTYTMAASAVVLVHNQLPFTRVCLEPLLETDGLDEVIVVDNGSTDGTPAYLRSLRRQARRATEVRLLRMEENLGGSAARNLGVRAATGEIIAFVDNDAYPADRAWLNRVRERLAAGSAGAVAPMLVYPSDGEWVQSAGGGVTLGGHFGLLGRGRPRTDPTVNEPRLLAWAPAAAMACRHDLFDEAGGFDESFDPVSIGEDIDFCFKLRRAGAEIVYEPAVRFLHFEGTTFNNSSFSHRKREVFIERMRLLRQRWAASIRDGPTSTEEEIAYVLVRKHYADLRNARVTVSNQELGSFADPMDGRL